MGLEKEMTASQGSSLDSPGISYDLAMAGTAIPGARKEWINQIGRNYANIFHSLLPKHCLFPYVNRTKNISRESARLYNRYRDKPIAEVTTNDLEMLYFQEGIKIGGPCELRSSFKFNDTKPRVYYAQGGEAYFQSRFCKALAVSLMESLQATKEIHRRRPDEYLNRAWYDWEDPHSVLYWDLTSFTTRLNDLRFFLHALVTNLRRKGNIRIQVFERHGPKQIDLCDLLDEYNHRMCYLPEFSFERFIHQPEDLVTTLMSRQGGLLGVPGNIGFSTSLHGFVSEMVSGEGFSVCVGDDAAAAGLGEIGNQVMVDQIKRIGLIPEDKFGLVTAQTKGRFLKRGITINQNDGIQIHQFLPALPHLVEILGIQVPGRTQDIEVPYFRAKKMCEGIAAVLWKFHDFPDEVSEVDINALQTFAFRMYQVFNLPAKGCFPGGCSIKDSNGITESTVTFTVPPLPFQDYDPRYIDWVDFAVQQRKQRYLFIPRYTQQVMKIQVGGETVFHATGSPLLGFLEDHGLVRKEPVLEGIDLGEEGHQRKLKDFLRGFKGLRQVYRVEILKPLTSIDVDYGSLVEYPPLTVDMDGAERDY